jgi:hypothetical protein
MTTIAMPPSQWRTFACRSSLEYRLIAHEPFFVGGTRELATGSRAVHCNGNAVDRIPRFRGVSRVQRSREPTLGENDRVNRRIATESDEVCRRIPASERAVLSVADLALARSRSRSIRGTIGSRSNRN